MSERAGSGMAVGSGIWVGSGAGVGVAAGAQAAITRETATSSPTNRELRFMIFIFSVSKVYYPTFCTGFANMLSVFYLLCLLRQCWFQGSNKSINFEESKVFHR
jgi:hypothetical protein